ncbi:MAG TPA: TadE family protein [Bryobacteraceae bacterium]|nr:TadE family protein [Bryobacteraceae bacterium]
MRGRRGSTMLEGALVMTTFVILLIGAMDFGRLGFAYSSITFAAHQAARFAATNGSSSGHAATAANVQSSANSNLLGLNPGSLTVLVTWSPNNNPGSQVQVQVSYGFQPLVVPISSSAVTLRSTAVDTITQ